MGFYNSFEAASLDSNYSSTSSNLTPSIITSDPTPQVGARALKLYKSGGLGGETTNHGVYRNDYQIGPPVKLTYYFAKSSNYYHSIMCFGIQNNPSTSYAVTAGANSSSSWVRIVKHTGTFGHTASNVLVAGSTAMSGDIRAYLGTSGNWVKCEVEWTTTSITATFYKMDGVSLGSLSVNDSLYGKGGFGWGTNMPSLFGGATTMFYDAVIYEDDQPIPLKNVVMCVI